MVSTSSLNSLPQLNISVRAPGTTQTRSLLSGAYRHSPLPPIPRSQQRAAPHTDRAVLSSWLSCGMCCSISVSSTQLQLCVPCSSMVHHLSCLLRTPRRARISNERWAVGGQTTGKQLAKERQGKKPKPGLACKQAGRLMVMGTGRLTTWHQPPFGFPQPLMCLPSHGAAQT